ncbi:MAG: hypothetical protein LH609_09090 [Rudanella sp.]|nr:hypothetical protein [Rudanella sp.]
MTAKLNWTKEAFSREVVITSNGQTVGGMHRNLLERDVEASLNKTHIKFDVMGFLLHSVNIHDLGANNQIIGTITFRFGKRAELQLANGDRYTWKRHNILMRDWDMIREGATDAADREVVNYHLTRQFLSDHGDISVDTGVPQLDVVILTGLFVRNYFQRRRRAAA